MSWLSMATDSFGDKMLLNICSGEPRRTKPGEVECGVSKYCMRVHVASVHGKGLDGHGLTGLRGW